MGHDAYGNYQCVLDTSGAGSSTPVGGGPTASSGMDDPNTLTLADSVLIYQQFDVNEAPKATWVRQDSSSTWYQTVVNS